MHSSELKKFTATAVPIFLFLVFALFFIFSKSLNLEIAAQLLLSGISLQEHELGYMDMPTLPASMRVGVGWVYLTIETVLKTLSRLMVNDPTAAPLYPGLGWGFGVGFQPGYIGIVIVPLVSSVAWKLLALSPIYFLALTAYHSLLSRVVFLWIVMTALVGWPDLLLNFYYTLMRLIFDWPISYYLFTTSVVPYDFGAIFFLNLLCLYIIKVHQIKMWHVILLTTIGQLIFENLGLVTGVSLFLWTLWTEPDRAWGLGAQRLVTAGIVSFAILGTMIVVIHKINPGAFDHYVEAVLIQDDRLVPPWVFRKPGIFENMWNFVDPKFTASLFITVFTFPIALGAVFGAIVGWRCVGRNSASVDRSFRATGAVASAFFLSMIIGLPVSGYLSELGRQALSGVTIFFATSALGTELFVRRRLMNI